MDRVRAKGGDPQAAAIADLNAALQKAAVRIALLCASMHLCSLPLCILSVLSLSTTHALPTTVLLFLSYYDLKLRTIYTLCGCGTINLMIVAQDLDGQYLLTCALV